MIMSESPEKGLSKNALKKAAKKAEKAALKAGGDATAAEGAVPAAAEGAAEGAAPADVKAVAEPEATTSSSSSSSSGASTTMSISNLKSENAASAKVVWASLVYEVPLQVQPSASVGGDTIEGNHPVLWSGKKDSVSGGGNAMALTISFLSKTKTVSLMEQLLQDDWCEWERTVLRKANTEKALTAALEHLNSSLTHGSGIYVCGTSMTVADICILSTLWYSVPATTTFPAAVQRYMHAHAAYWTKVEQTLEEWISLQEAAAAPAASTSFAPLDLKQPSLNTLVDTIFRQLLHQLFGLSADELPANIVTKCSSPKHGDYQCSAAMPAFAALKSKGTLPQDIKSPPMLAQALVDAIGTDHPAIDSLAIQGPGFVLCRVRAKLLQDYINAFLESGKLPLPADIKPQTCVVDFSSPNIAKEMHVGHLRSTIIGEAVCRILELVGHKVHRVNHVGDWGTQFGMLIQYLKDKYPDVASGDGSGELPNITDLTEFYKSSKQCFDESPEFKKQSQLNVVQLQSGDPDCLRIWKLLCDISRKEFEKVYQRLDVTVEECGESFYNDKIPSVIQEFAEKGLLQAEEGGAKLVFVEGFQVPLMLQKTDGGFGYDSTDMAALKYRLQDLKADRIICITDFSQGDHFKMVNQAGHAVGWVDRGQRLQHIGFGTVQGEDGKRFKTRSGDTVRLVDLLDEAAARMEATLKERIQKGESHITEQEAHIVAEAIGYGSVKYFDLRRNPTSNYQFSYDMMLDTKGDTGVYLLYARVRLESIMAKAQAEHGADLDNLGTVAITHESERKLVLALQQFPDVLAVTLDDLYPYHICKYVYDLSIASTEFVTKCRVLGTPEMSSRLLLCQATAMAMKQCFDLLGIRHVMRI